MELVAPDALPSGAIAQGVARLHHKVLDDAVEDEPVVVPVLAVHREILHCLGAPVVVVVVVFVVAKRVGFSRRARREKERRGGGKRDATHPRRAGW